MVAEWMEIAASDLHHAQRLIDDPTYPDPFYSAFHSQQAAEKALKAWLEWQKVIAPYTHNIQRLLRKAEESGLPPGPFDGADTLTTYGVTTRYPGLGRCVEPMEAIAARKIAAAIYQAVREALITAGFPVERLPK